MKNIESNDARFLYLLRNLGPQQFENLVKYSGLSRSTVSKYLKLHEKQNNITKKLFEGKQKYCITEQGVEKLNEAPRAEGIFFNEITNHLSKLSEMYKYYKSIAVDDSIIFQIIRLVSNIGDNFYIIEQNEDLFLTLFYIFLNSVLTPEYKFEMDSFCKHYKIKRLRINFYVDKMMSSKLGFFLFRRRSEEGDDLFFFHEEDILGTTTLRLVKDKLMEEIIHFNMSGQQISHDFDKILYDLDKMAEDISEKLIKMDLIWERIKIPFEMLIEKIMVKMAIDMGISKITLMDIVLQSEKLSSSIEGVKSLFNIIEGSEKYEDLNLVSISESQEIIIEDILERVQGFCPNCGKSILKQDFSKVCPKCETSYEPESLLKSIDDAAGVSVKYKHLIYSSFQEE
ncbi:MAG: hypothetical protein ACFFBP_20515 [Promethearchaeota archaeon]